MELRHVTFTVPLSVGGNPVVDIDGVDMAACADYTARVVRIGRHVVPFERVLVMQEGESEQTCPECGRRDFANSQALGSHRRHKHQVKGCAE